MRYPKLIQLQIGSLNAHMQDRTLLHSQPPMQMQKRDEVEPQSGRGISRCRYARDKAEQTLDRLDRNEKSLTYAGWKESGTF